MDDKKIRLSVAIATYNEAENIGACLESVKEIADEIIVVDGTSPDNTAKIAASLGAQVIITDNKSNFHLNKQMAIDACKGDWILQLDADERVSSMLAKEIKRVIQGDLTQAPSAYYLKRRNYFLGRWMNKGGMYPDPVIRLFQKGKARLPGKSVHELMEVDGATAWLSEDLLHLADPTFSRYLKRNNRYSSLEAENWLKEGKIGVDTWTIIKYMYLKPFIRFVTIYIRHKGFMDGFPGFVFAWYSGNHIRNAYVKYYEKKSLSATISVTHDWE